MRDTRPALAAGVVALLLIGVALATPGGFALVESVASRPLRGELPVVGEYLLVALVVVSAITAILLAVKARSERPLDEESRYFRWLRAPWWIRVAVTIAGIVVIVIAVMLVVRAGVDLPSALSGLVGDAPPAGSDAPRAPGEAGGTNLVGWLATIVFAMAVTLVLALLFILITPEGSIADLAGVDPTDEVADSVELGLADLTTIANPRAAVLACYRTMTIAFRRAGVQERPSDTPFEFLERALVARRVDHDCARRLTELFERARFSNHTIDETTRREALSALNTVQNQLEAVR